MKSNKIYQKRIHIAIMKKSWGLTQKILMGEKTVRNKKLFPKQKILYFYLF